MEPLINEILADLTIELGLTESNDIAVLSSKVKRAVKEVRKDRTYPSHYTEEEIVKDLKNYYSNIFDLAMYDYNQIGAEGETSHGEGGTSRTWKNRRDCKDGVVAICKCF